MAQTRLDRSISSSTSCQVTRPRVQTTSANWEPHSDPGPIPIPVPVPVPTPLLIPVIPAPADRSKNRR